jgi:response regulator RpfG family c-di-GMP phosphodiesterase/serine/threonine protein kinase
MGTIAVARPTLMTPATASSTAGLTPRWTLDTLFAGNYILPDDWNRLPRAAQQELAHWPNLAELPDRLVEHGLLTAYQASRLRIGREYGLVLGHYRVLDRLGAGGMGVVYKAEHVLLRRLVAVKVLSLNADQDSRLLLRFRSEMRAIGALRHSNIVAPLDAGYVPSPFPTEPALHYLVMEYVEGTDLEEMVLDGGPLPVALACDLAWQVASGLAEAHAHGLVHRDIKPSNVLVTAHNDAKLLDFGLAQDFRCRLTEPGVLLGTLDYMAPEQAQDAHAVDIRADLFGLGGVLYWSLTGQPPFPPQGPAAVEIVRRLTQPPPSARERRPDVPPALDAVLARLLAPRPDDRYATPQAVTRALAPFRGDGAPAALALSNPTENAADGRLARLLVVDDEDGIRMLCRHILRGLPIELDEVTTGAAALEAAGARSYDLVLLDVNLPDLSGFEVLKALRAGPLGARLRVLLVSGAAPPDELAKSLLAGADDFLTKPFSAVQLQGRVQAALRLQRLLDHADGLSRHLRSISADLERTLADRDGDLAQARSALVLALANVVGQRATETEGHLLRVQHYIRLLAEAAAQVRPFDGLIDQDFIRDLECCAPLHDIGVVALPDHILMKPGKLDAEERVVMQTHTTIGADLLQKVLHQYGTGVRFLRTAVELARHHHERWDGSGYPDRLAGDAIPLSARLFALCDVYDAIRSRRAHRPGLSHHAAVQVITETSPGHFDPRLIDVFQAVASQFEAVYRKHAD